jgi:hypothetical protein
LRGGTTRGIAWVCSAAGLALVLAGTALGLAAETRFGPQAAFSLAYVLISGTVGGLVASRHRRNAIGWILCGLTVWAGVYSLARGGAQYLLADGGASQVWGERAAWVASWSFVPLMFVPATFLLLLFPDGRLPSRRFRPVAWFAGGVIAFWIVTVAVDPGPLFNFESVLNPHGVDAPALQLASDLVAPIMLVCVLASAASVVARTRRANSLERQQIKWLAFAGCLEVALLVAGGLLYDSAVGRTLVAVGLLSLPVAIGVAILRYRLYDIDVVISRTLVYVPLLAIIGGVSPALVPLAQRVSRGVIGSDSDATIVLTTLLVAALVTPVRKRLETVVEGRFRFGPRPNIDTEALLEDPKFAALVASIAERAARETVHELASGRELPVPNPGAHPAASEPLLSGESDAGPRDDAERGERG